jgi:HD superfamily phosphohydrolase
VDKLDYIHRDGYATGLRLVVDLDRSAPRRCTPSSARTSS